MECVIEFGPDARQTLDYVSRYLREQYEKVKGHERARIVLFDDETGAVVGSADFLVRFLRDARWDVIVHVIDVIERNCDRRPVSPMFRIEPYDEHVAAPHPEPEQVCRCVSLLWGHEKGCRYAG